MNSSKSHVRPVFVLVILAALGVGLAGCGPAMPALFSVLVSIGSVVGKTVLGEIVRVGIEEIRIRYRGEKIKFTVQTDSRDVLSGVCVDNIVIKNPRNGKEIRHKNVPVVRASENDSWELAPEFLEEVVAALQ